MPVIVIAHAFLLLLHVYLFAKVIFSNLLPGTRIRPHCAPTNVRLTAHLGIVVPTSSPEQRCRLRVADQWLTWEEGKILVFDDSYEHEVENMTSTMRAVLLLRFWHPDLAGSRERQRQVLDQALRSKRCEELRRYNPPVPVRRVLRRTGVNTAAATVSISPTPRQLRMIEQRALEQSACSQCWNTGYQSLRVVNTSSNISCFGEYNGGYGEDEDQGAERYSIVCSCGAVVSENQIH